MKKLLSFVAVAALLCFVSCQKPPADNKGDNQNNTENTGDNTGNNTPKGVTIDGQFEDWANLPADSFITVTSKQENTVSVMRIFPTKDYIYYYVKYAKEMIKDQLEAKDALNVRINITTDGEFTSGYTGHTLDGIDFTMEGHLAADGAFDEFKPTLYQWNPALKEGKGNWEDIKGVNVATGAGAGAEYEIAVSVAAFNDAASKSFSPMPIQKTFHTSMRFYQNGWDTLTNLPNTEPTEADPEGKGHLVEVTIPD